MSMTGWRARVSVRSSSESRPLELARPLQATYPFGAPSSLSSRAGGGRPKGETWTADASTDA